jgi:hypothetical protein
VRRKPRGDPWPEHLATFNEGDWQEWTGDGPDPAEDRPTLSLAEHYSLPHLKVIVENWGTAVPVKRRLVIVGIGDTRPWSLNIDAWTRASAGGRRACAGPRITT